MKKVDIGDECYVVYVFEEKKKAYIRKKKIFEFSYIFSSDQKYIEKIVVDRDPPSEGMEGVVFKKLKDAEKYVRLTLNLLPETKEVKE